MIYVINFLTILLIVVGYGSYSSKLIKENRILKQELNSCQYQFKMCKQFCLGHKNDKKD